MATPFTGTEVYVDPSIAGDSGAGTVGDPYGDLEWALENVTRNTTEGDRFNIKAGTDEILAANLATAIAVYGSPGGTAPLIFQGYTTAAGDGGKGGISGGGSVPICDSTATDNIFFYDLHLHNTGSNLIINLDSNCQIIRCEIDNSTNTGNTCELGTNSVFMSNYVHNVAGAGIAQCPCVMFNYFENETNDMTTAIVTGLQTSIIERNIIDVDGTTDGISTSGYGIILNNSIYSAAGTGQGITQVNGGVSLIVMNNIVEGFSGTGGIGYDFNGNNASVNYLVANASYNNATHYSGPDTGDFYVNHGWGSATDSNSTLTSSAFTDAANKDFSPVNADSVIKELSEPQTFTSA